MNRFVNRCARLSLVGLAGLSLLALVACSVLESDKIDYKSAAKAPTLEVPPDLSQLSRETRYALPGTPVSANSLQAGQPAQASTPTAAASVGDVHIERAGSQRWLVVSDRPPEKLWDDVRDFWQENGFVLTQEQRELGIMETDWAENRAKIPQDFIRSTIGKVFDGLYSTGERDKFRTRLERTSTGGTEIYISHRGMMEVYADPSQQAQTVWQPRPPDPELEAEFLRRLMVKLGVSQEQSKVLIAAGQNPAMARVTTVNNVPVVQVSEGFDRAWRRVGLTLDRTGFTVEDRDRSAGLYFVRYVAPTTDGKKDPGFLSRLFGAGKAGTDTAPLKYRISVRGENDVSTVVSVLNASGAPETSADAKRILQVIADDLK